MSSNSKTHYGEISRYLLVWKQHYQCFSTSLLLSSHLQRLEASRYIDCTHRYQTHLQRRADSWRREDMRGEQAGEELLCRQATFDPALLKYWPKKHRTQWRRRIPWRKWQKFLNRSGPWCGLAQEQRRTATECSEWQQRRSGGPQRSRSCEPKQVTEEPTWGYMSVFICEGRTNESQEGEKVLRGRRT